ncbi:MAG TPA: amidohydrolase family protein [Luteimonas sp.]|nr:amidohydrolase family protein [Luteimonas sp.]
MAKDTLLALRGRVVTMDAKDTVLKDGVVYLRNNRIAAVLRARAAPPEGFEDVAVLDTKGTLYPGLVDLHNHLSYNALQLWDVPQRYTNRDDWARHPDYRRLISGPMNVLGQSKGYPEAIARYAECKSLLGGVTTSQGIALFSNAGIRRCYRGLLRNVEISDGDDLPAASARIGDVAPKDARKFYANLKKCSCLLLHLSEGTDARARAHFDALKLGGGKVAITGALSGIHCVALEQADFRLMARHDGTMVWSPLSNLLLYGRTADIRAAKAAGMLVGIGCDWSPSGSKNLLGELKAAHACNRVAGRPFAAKEIVAMATRNAARILKWEQGIGSLEAGKRADLVVVAGTGGDPYLHLVRAGETDIALVVVDGVRRCGVPKLMPANRRGLEAWKVGRQQRLLDLRGNDLDPLTKGLGLRKAAARLEKGLKTLKALARRIENPRTGALDPRAGAAPHWFLELDQPEPVPVLDERTGAVAMPLSQLLGSLRLDPLGVADDRSFVKRLLAQANIPPPVRATLRTLHR